MKRKRLSVESNILITIVISVIAVLSIGIFAYRTMSEIVGSISEEAKPDVKLVLMENILSDLFDAESSVKSYSITNNSDYLFPFYRAASSIDDKVRDLNRLSVDDPEQQPAIDSVSRLIDQKFYILKELILAQHDDRVAATLKKLSKKIDEAQERATKSINDYTTKRNKYKKQQEDQIAEQKRKEEEEAKRKKNVFERLFGGKKKKKQEAAAAAAREKKDAAIRQELMQPFDATAPVKEVKKEVAKMKKQEAKFTQVYRKEQLELTAKDKVVMDKLRFLIRGLEDKERKDIIVKTIEAEDMAATANRLIAAFCLAISLLLFVLGYTITSYIRKNRAYSKVLSQAKTEAENLAQAKESFLANMSHEIRTPMNAIVGFTEQVLKSPLNEEQKEQIEIIKKSSDHLLNIINDILDLSKLGAGKIDLERIAFQPMVIADEIVSLLKQPAENKGIKLYASAKGSLPEVLMGDPLRLKQILLNLVGNAIKFTDTGEVKIELETHQDTRKNDILKVSVIDTGIGIPKDKLTSIFNEFEQAANTTARSYGGTGLGLSITKKLIELQEGHIHVQSEMGKGTTIVFTIPYEEGTTADLTQRTEVVIDKNMLKGTRVLIADDGEYNRKLVASILTNWGIAYAEAVNGKEAVELLQKDTYDIVLMDLLMPEMNGVEATTYIRKKLKDKKSTTPVIGLTAATSNTAIAQCKEAGMNDFLNKPFKEQELFIKMLTILRPEALKKITTIPLQDKKPHEHAISSLYNLEELHKLANGDPAFVTDMIHVFIRTTTEGVKKLKNSLESGNWDTVADMAHHIAPPFRHIDSIALLHLIKTIENNARSQTNIGEIPALVQQLEKDTQMLISLLEKETMKTTA